MEELKPFVSLLWGDVMSLLNCTLDSLIVHFSDRKMNYTWKGKSRVPVHEPVLLVICPWRVSYEVTRDWSEPSCWEVGGWSFQLRHGPEEGAYDESQGVWICNVSRPPSFVSFLQILFCIYLFPPVTSIPSSVKWVWFRNLRRGVQLHSTSNSFFVLGIDRFITTI